jgi:hypothetical protein
VDLVDEQQRALADLAAVLGRLEDLPQVGDARERGRQRLEDQVGRLGEESGDGGLPAAGRSPQDRGDQSLAPDHAPERRVRREQVVLADHLAECARAQPVGQRPGRLLPEQRQRRLGMSHR